MSDDLRREAEALVFEIAKIDGLNDEAIIETIVKRFKAQHAAEARAIQRQIQACHLDTLIQRSQFDDWLDRRLKEWET
jgi:hypothetical protein